MSLFTIITIIIAIVLFAIIRRASLDFTSNRMLKIFAIYWFVSVLLASVGVFDIFEIHTLTYMVVLLGVIFFCFGFIAGGKNRSPIFAIEKDEVSAQFESLASNIIYRIILIIASIYVSSLLVIFFEKIMFYQSLASVRTDFYAAELYGPLYSQLNAFFLRPLYLVTLPVFAYLILYKRNWICFLSGYYLVGYESLSGGRIGYIRIALGVLFIAYCLLRTFKNNKRRGISLLVISGLAIFALLVIVSAARMGSVGLDKESRQVGLETTTEHIVSYTACPIAALDHSITHNYSSLIGGYQYGKLTLTPVITFINLFTSRIGFSLSVPLNDLVEYKQSIPIDIAPELDWNALYTANLYFYNDFGVLGVIIFPFLFGLLISRLISQMYKYRSIPLIMIVSFCFWCMVDSVLDYAFVSAYDFMTLLIMYFLGTRKSYIYKR